MVVAKDIQPAVRRYLEQLELELKKLSGVVPEDALCDAREFLIADSEALARSGEPPSEMEHFDWIMENYGAPEVVAQQYADQANPFPVKHGFAPGWRICCTKCGRSSPLASVGAIRIGAKSWHKYHLAFCRGCKRVRFARIIQDMDEANLTEQLGLKRLPEQVRSTMHRPVMTFVGIFGAIAATFFLVAAIALSIIFFASQAVAQDTKANAEAIGRLKQSIKMDYSYADLHQVDWDKRIESFRNELTQAKTPEAFATAAAKCMSEAKDSHIWFKVGDKTIGTFQHSARTNFNPRVLPKLIPSLSQHGKTVLVGTTRENFRYVAIATWDHRDDASMAKAVEAVREATKNKQPLILDVRANSGGDEMQARKVASYFVSKPTPYASHSTRSGGKDSAVQQRAVTPDTEGLLHPGPCIVLMGPTNMSSCESFLMMMRAAGARLIGEKSTGTSGNPKPHELGNGVTLFLPSWRDMDLEGKVIEGKGIEPDVVVKTKTEDFALSDPVFLEACKQLSQK